MPSITSWIRLEPRSRDASMEAGVAARLHDPLWLLARQWQLGEFHGEDGGSAVTARTRLDVAPVAGFAAGASGPPPAADASDGGVPLEARVEAGPAPAPARGLPALRARAEAGRHLVRMLDAAGIAVGPRLVALYPIAISAAERTALDPAAARLLAAVAPRVPDGDAAAAALAPLEAGGDGPFAEWGVAPTRRDAAGQLCRAWLAWRRELVVARPADAWDRDRLAYQFRLRADLAGTGVVLGARDHRGDELDWYSVDRVDHVAGAPAAPPIVRTAIPTAVGFRGMPARRYWELEDAAADWGAVEAGPDELAHMLLTEFAFGYGGDWCVVPVRIPAGSLARVASLVVTDSFGVQTLVASARSRDGSAARWGLFGLTGDAGDGAPALLLAPRLPTALEGPSLDEVGLVHDEYSNVVWAIERRTEGALGRGVDTPSVAAPPDAPDRPTYRLGTAVPAGRVPLRAIDGAGGVRLVPAGVPGAAASPLASVLDGARLVRQAVPREGRTLIRRYRAARGSDGRLVVWIERSSRPGAADQPPRLAFDVLVPGGDL